MVPAEKLRDRAVSETSKSIALALAIAVVATAPALTQQIGTATAVNPSTEGTPPGGSTTMLAVGARVLHNERIHTSSTGSMQLLFLDKSTLSVAPNTSLVINEFVYDPASKSGHMLTKLTQGTLQYIGGELSHQGAVTIATPLATIGIRGAIGIADVQKELTFISQSGGKFHIENGGGSMDVTRPGFVVTVVDWNTAPGQPVPVTADKVADKVIRYIENLSSKFGQDGGVPGFKGLAAGGFACGTYATPLCPQPTWQPTNTGENDAALQIIMPSTQRATQPNPPPPPPPPTNFSVR